MTHDEGGEAWPALSDQLEAWMQADRPRTIGGLTDTFGAGSFSILFIVLMAFPALPLPTGGISHVLEVLTMLLALELVVGREEVWIPARWQAKELGTITGPRFSAALLKRIRWFERFARPRWSRLIELRLTGVLFGIIVFGLSLTAFLAPPFSGLDTLPSLGVVILSLGVLLHDVLVATIGGGGDRCARSRDRDRPRPLHPRALLSPRRPSGSGPRSGTMGPSVLPSWRAPRFAGGVAERIVILGAGTGGTLSANRLRRLLPTDQADITVVDQDDRHVYQPGLLFVPFGLTHPEDIVRQRCRQLHDGISFVEAAIDRVDIEANRVHLIGGRTLDYDVLIVASGAELVPEETEGLTGPGWMEKVFTFYTPEGAGALEAALATFDGGRLVVNVVDMPIKCPVAPLEFCFLADWYFTERGIRDRVQLIYATPLDGAFTKPVASAHLRDMLVEKGVELITEFNTGEVDGAAGTLVGYDGREIPFDLAVVVPLHGGAAYVGRSPGLGDELNFVPTDEHTLQAKAAPNVFVIGDAANVPASKAGSVTHFEGDTLVENVRRHLAGEPLEPGFDGHANCFIETGFHKALLIDFNYDTEPLTGHFPSAVGLPLLKESRLNHLGKLMFQWFYWHTLLPGRDIPGIGSRMPTAGKIDPPEE